VGDHTVEERICLMEQRQDYFECSQKEFKDTLKYASRLITGTLITTTITLVMLIIRFQG